MWDITSSFLKDSDLNGAFSLTLVGSISLSDEKSNLAELLFAWAGVPVAK
jgi:hypothetical protein